MIEDRQSKTLLADETVQRLRAHRQRQWQKVAADFNKRLDEANERADASIAAWLAAHKERVALGMTTDGGTTTDHCDTEGMTEEVADENAPLVNGQGYVWAEGYGGRPGPRLGSLRRLGPGLGPGAAGVRRARPGSCAPKRAERAEEKI